MFQSEGNHQMAQAAAVFVKVLGFTDVERHALNTVFRLSESGPVHYMLWMPDAPAAPQLALVDGDSYEAGLDELLAQPSGAAGAAGITLIWIGANPPQQAWRVFGRPLHWPHVLQAMDSQFGEADDGLDFDLELAGPEDIGGPDTQPPPAEPAPPRALIVAARLEDRLYLRARLSLADLTLADEADTGASGQELARQPYAVVLFEWDLYDGGWPLARALKQAQPNAQIICMKAGASLLDNWRAHRLGLAALLDKPPHPARLQHLLRK